MVSTIRRKVLVTGSKGFIGTRLVPYLTEAGWDAVGADFDLLDFSAMISVVQQAPWDAVVHLAGISHIPTCEEAPSRGFSVNTAGTAALLEAMRRAAPQARLVFAGSSLVYRAPNPEEGRQGLVITEERAIAPQNTYAQTKWAAELLIEDACRRESLRATVLRLFNHTHKSQSPDFFLPRLYKAIRDAQEKHPGEPIELTVGNLHVARDIGAVQDLVAAFAAVLERPQTSGCDAFNVCSGIAKRLSTLADGLAARLDAKLVFVTDPARVRADEPEILLGSHERLAHATGWRPRYANESDLLDAFLAN
jgi:GDP-4-dehydro-6-deoxy-D-mannose reductase